MTERICDARKKLDGRKGVVSYLIHELEQDWDDCSGYSILSVDNDGYEYTVKRLNKTAGESIKKYTLLIPARQCECGEWQDKGYPCIDALAYFCLIKRYSFHHILDEYVDKLYRYETEMEMMSQHVLPVCIETVAPDGCTLPPDPNLKRASGRPKKKRLRKRPRTACNPEESPIVCKRCGVRGHNRMTCERREAIEREQIEKGVTAGLQSHNLDLS